MVNILDREAAAQIVDAIHQAELVTSGEIRVHIRRKCGEDTLKEAQKVFRKLGMHKTKNKNGVLLFIAQESHRFAIVGDEGIHRNVGDLFWNKTRDLLAEAFSQEKYKEGIINAIHDIGDKLKAFFPVEPGDKNELPNTVTSD